MKPDTETSPRTRKWVARANRQVQTLKGVTRLGHLDKKSIKFFSIPSRKDNTLPSTLPSTSAR